MTPEISSEEEEEVQEQLEQYIKSEKDPTESLKEDSSCMIIETQREDEEDENCKYEEEKYIIGIDEVGDIRNKYHSVMTGANRTLGNSFTVPESSSNLPYMCSSFVHTPKSKPVFSPRHLQARNPDNMSGVQQTVTRNVKMRPSPHQLI